MMLTKSYVPVHMAVCPRASRPCAPMLRMGRCTAWFSYLRQPRAVATVLLLLMTQDIRIVQCAAQPRPTHGHASQLHLPAAKSPLPPAAPADTVHVRAPPVTIAIVQTMATVRSRRAHHCAAIDTCCCYQYTIYTSLAVDSSYSSSQTVPRLSVTEFE